MGRYSYRKKLRGSKRGLRRLQKEGITPAVLDQAGLAERHYYYEKLGLHPWHWHHRQPPKRVRQLAAQHLLTTFFDWQHRLTSLSGPSYLAVWIAKPEFAHSSQVVTAIRTRLDQYKHIFGDPSPDGPPLPPEYQLLPGTNRLAWQTYPWHILVDSFDYPNGWPAWALEKPHYLCEPEDNDAYLMVQTSWMWVGQLAKPTHR